MSQKDFTRINCTRIFLMLLQSQLYLIYLFFNIYIWEPLKYFLSTMAFYCLIQSREKYSTKETKIGWRESFFRFTAAIQSISLDLNTLRPIKSLTAFLKHTDYLTLTLLRARSNRYHLPKYLSFSAKDCSLHWTKYENWIQRRRKIYRKTWQIFWILNKQTAISNQQLRVILPVLPVGGYIDLLSSLLWVLFLLYNV
jgi:hypothetical protein